MRTKQSGFSLFEMIVATALTSLIGVWSATTWMQQSDDAASEAMGRWLISVKQSVDQMLVRQADFLTGISAASESSRIYRDIWHPTLDDLMRAGHLATGFSKRPPLGYDLSIKVLKPAGLCLTQGCKLEALTVVTPQSTHLVYAANLTRIGKILSSFGGQGASVSQLSPLRVRGSNVDLPNPPVADMAPLPLGSIVLYSFYDSSAQVSYLRQGDKRDVQLGANLRAAGRIDAGGDIASRGGISASGAITAGGSIRAAERISSAGHLQLGAMAIAGTTCEGSGLLAQASAGGLLICQGGVWQRSAKSGGGYFIEFPGFRCDVREGINVDRRNPLTGDCSCPAGYVPQLVSIWRYPHYSYNEFYTYHCLS
jgi:hypothetical protein